MKSTAHIVGQTVSTVRSAYALKDVFEALAAAEKSGLSDEKKKELEDKAAQMVSPCCRLARQTHAHTLTIASLVTLPGPARPLQGRQAGSRVRHSRGVRPPPFRDGGEGAGGDIAQARRRARFARRGLRGSQEG